MPIERLMDITFASKESRVGITYMAGGIASSLFHNIEAKPASLANSGSVASSLFHNQEAYPIR